MEKFEIIFKTGSAIAGAVFGYLFGEWTVTLKILVAFVIIDYVTGWIASGVEGNLSSKVGFRGILKKLMLFCLVALGHLVDKAIGDGSMIQNAIIFFYLGNEGLSILENAGRTGLPIPQKVKDAIEVLRGKGE